MATDDQGHCLLDFESLGIKFIHDRTGTYPELDFLSYTALFFANEVENILNSGSFLWTPPDDSTLDSIGVGGWYLTLVDDATGETSTSVSFNILPPDGQDEFIGPYAPLVVGQPHTFNWSPSTAPTISLLIIRDSPHGTNVTLAGQNSPDIHR